MGKVLVLVFLIGTYAGAAESSERPSKYRQECAFTSEDFAKALPEGNVSVWCANDKRKDFGPMGRDVIHAIAVAAFRESRLDRREAAMNMLETYDCADLAACKEFHHLLDWGVKSNGPKKPTLLMERAMKLRDSTLEKVAKLTK